MPTAMADWSIDIINSYCEQLFGGKVLCEVTQDKGRIMIAKAPVARGDLLFSEAPLHIVAEEEENEAFLTVQRLCSDDPEDFDYDPLWYWAALCSLTEDDLRDAPKVGELKPVSVEQQQRLLCLYHGTVTESTVAVDKIVEELGLKVEPLTVEELLQAWILNCFEHNDDPLAYSAYFASSFISHSCGANAIWTEGEDALHVLRARENIAVGDEISISYLQEDELLHSAEARRKTLQDTKRFHCGCERCAPQGTGDENAQGLDFCRGFTCTSCGECGVFYCLDYCKPKQKGNGKGKAEGKGVPLGLSGAKCRNCGATIDEQEADLLLEAEGKLEDMVTSLTDAAEEKSVREVINEEGARELLQLVGNHESSRVGPQHWLCSRAWEFLEKWYKALDRRVDQRQMLELRVDYQRKSYPGLSGTLAWTLEQQGVAILRHLGFGSKMADSDREFQGSLVQQVEPIFEESLRILRLMFGSEHEYFTAVEAKYTNAKRYLQIRKNVTERKEAAAPAANAQQPAAVAAEVKELSKWLASGHLSR